MTRTYVMTDIHGMYDLFDRALSEIYDREPMGAKIVFLGDYIDRGPDSHKVIDRLMRGPENDLWKWVIIRGNHEDMAVECVNGENIEWWIANGGGATLSGYGGSIPKDHIMWMDGLPRLWWDNHRVYVHAGVQEHYALDQQPEAVTQWMRYPSGASVGHRGRHVVHGHTPQRHGPELLEHRTNLDTGAVFGGCLTVGVFDDGKPGGPVHLFEISRSADQ